MLQRYLNKLGYTDENGKPLTEDGDFGIHTQAAVDKFKDAVLPGSNTEENRGIVDAATWEALRRSVSNKLGAESRGGVLTGTHEELFTNEANATDIAFADYVERNIAIKITNLPDFITLDDVESVEEIIANINMTDDNKNILDTALGEINKGGTTFQDWAKIGDSNWCAAFVSWCAEQVGNDSVPCFMNVISTDEKSGVGQYAADGRFMLTMDVSKFEKGVGLNDKAKKYEGYFNPDYAPQSGDVVFFRWDDDDYHVGLVLFADPNSDYIYTIEGNTSGENSGSQVAVKRRHKSYIFGYGVNS
jgi:hypothetical protein